MQRTASLTLRAYFYFVVAGPALVVSGCGQFGPRWPGDTGVHPEYQAATPAVDALDGVEAQLVDQMQQVAWGQSRRLSEALGKKSFAAQWVQDKPKSGAQVKWLDVATSGPRSTASTRASRSLPTRNPLQDQPADLPQPVARPASLDRDILLSQLRDVVRAGDATAMDKALTAVGLSLIDPGRVLDPADLTALSPPYREQVRQYHKILLALSQELVSAKGRLDEGRVMKRIQGLFGEQPLRVSTVELCRRVRGYGVYEAFDSHVFLAGREQPIIIYAEVDHYQTVEAENSRYQVKLAQEVVLYNESDGLAVWRQPRVEILDESRNQRRDFFVVQMIRLPQRLGVGKYVLKVRVTDLHNQSLDEATIPIQLVADQSMVSGGVK